MLLTCIKKAPSNLLKAVKDKTGIHFKGGFFSPRSEPVPVPGPAQLPGPPGPVGDGLHGGLGWYCASLSLFIQPSAPDRSFFHGTQPGKAEPLNMNHPPRSNDVSSAESQPPRGRKKRNMSPLMNNAAAAPHEKHKTNPCFTGLFTSWLLLRRLFASGGISGIASS